MRRHNLWSGIAAGALLLAPLAARAAADDQVVPATSEDIQTFEKAVQERSQTQAKERERDQERLRTGEHTPAVAPAVPEGKAVKEPSRVREEKTVREQEKLGEAVSEEAKKMKNEGTKAQDRLRKQTREQEQLREETQEQLRTRQRQGWDAVRDTTVESGQRHGETAGPAGTGGTKSGGETGGTKGGSGSGSSVGPIQERGK